MLSVFKMGGIWVPEAKQDAMTLNVSYVRTLQVPVNPSQGTSTDPG